MSLVWNQFQKLLLIYLNRVISHMSQDSGAREFIVEPQELLDALRIARAQSYWLDSSATYRQSIISWIEKTRRRSAKMKRIESVVDHCVRGEQLPNHQSS